MNHNDESSEWSVSDETLTWINRIVSSVSAKPNADTESIRHLELACDAYVAQREKCRLSLISTSHGEISNWQLKRAQSMLAKGFSQSIDMKDVADACAMSLGYFARSFKIATGKSPRRWLAELRLEHAKFLLLNTPDPIIDIARKCGFSEQCHFTRIFTKEVGMSPGSWRRAFNHFYTTDDSSDDEKRQFCAI
jgi:transcriptional regulator GlxA family with amidase domain